MRTGRIGRESEIKEMGAQSDERRRVQGVINFSNTYGEKNLFGAEGGKRMKGEDKRRRKSENMFITPIMKTLHLMTSY